MSNETGGSSSSDWGRILTEQYEEGADDVEVMAALGLSRKSFDETYESNPVFRKLVDIGRVKSAAWWRTTARKNIFNKNFNTGIWLPTMKNRFGWTEKTEATINEQPEKQKSTDELRSELLAKMEGMAKALGATKKEADILIMPSGKKDG